MSVDHGKVAFEGRTFELTDQAQLTNRVFPGWFGDVKEGEQYEAEWFAPGVDSEGNEVQVRWIFTVTKGEEAEPDTWNWDKPYRVIAI